MILRKFTLDDYEEVVQMQYDFFTEIYPDRKISPKYFYYKAVQNWINDKKDIVLAINGKGTITGMSVSFVDEGESLTEPIYTTITLYTKPEFRKGKTSYLLLQNMSNYTKEINISWMSNCRIDNDTDKMIEKHFDCKRVFTNLERTNNG